MTIRESDWKTFKRVHAAALERFCQQILEECRAIGAQQGNTAQERYLNLYHHLQARNREIVQAFDDFRRSSAARCVIYMRRQDLLTDDEIGQFSSAFQRATRIE